MARMRGPFSPLSIQVHKYIIWCTPSPSLLDILNPLPLAAWCTLSPSLLDILTPFPLARCNPSPSSYFTPSPSLLHMLPFFHPPSSLHGLLPFLPIPWCTPPGLAWRRGCWTAAGASRWRSWCRTAQNCLSETEETIKYHFVDIAIRDHA